MYDEKPDAHRHLNQQIRDFVGQLNQIRCPHLYAGVVEDKPTELPSPTGDLEVCRMRRRPCHTREELPSI